MKVKKVQRKKLLLFVQNIYSTNWDSQLMNMFVLVLPLLMVFFLLEINKLRNNKTRMITSISSEGLLQPDRRTKYLQNRCSYTRGMCTQNMRTLSYIGAEKIILFPRNLTYRQTYIQTDGHQRLQSSFATKKQQRKSYNTQITNSYQLIY